MFMNWKLCWLGMNYKWEWARAKPTKQIQLSHRSALLIGAKIHKRPKSELIVLTVNRQREGICENVELRKGLFWERLVFVIQSSAKSQKARKLPLSCQRCIKIQECMPKKLATGQTWITAWHVWNRFQMPIALTADLNQCFWKCRALIERGGG